MPVTIFTFRERPFHPTFLNWRTIPLNGQACHIPEAGVYVIFSNSTVLYVGQSSFLKKRLSQHGFTCAGISPLSRWSKFKNVSLKVKYPRKYGSWAMDEIRLIRRLAPKFNIRHIGDI